ncbi:NAD(P)H-hydrate dehydratase [Candidatus Woesearchaeota archaeon]|nr:NAD(P)H-hydrate dehydratase [Candidatus Woesearchaeota archaeon]
MMKAITRKDIRLPRRALGSHKGDNGRVLVIGGSRDYVGAAALAGIAALRSGADWVTVAAPEKAGYAINALSADLVVKKYKGDHFRVSHVKGLLELERQFDSVLIGNGIGIKAGPFVRKYVNGSRKPLVIDADAIKVVSIKDVNNAILTPHRRELDIFLKNSGIKEGALRKRIGRNVILLKGRTDRIISSAKEYYNKTGNPGMTKAGTGDVLAGLCAGFLGQGLSLLQSAVNAAYFNGLAGDILLRKKKGFTYLASDLADELSRILRKHKV